ncbi:hypothetical protein [Azospirillum soli]|uniref:hypothetical protein n=1 Tax=Azospirillum soli TaxID=1304799 RepID=UPI001AE4E7D9|nr:hypothetical protein [Azospirillum soli]MBP2313393.1 uncharacterized membrane protein YheB (UPF0754 family) [Azospirillum soli]
MAEAVSLMYGLHMIPIAESAPVIDFHLSAERLASEFDRTLRAMLDGVRPAISPGKSDGSLARAVVALSAIKGQYARNARPHTIDRANSVFSICSKVVLTHFMNIINLIEDQSHNGSKEHALGKTYQEFFRNLGEKLSDEDYDTTSLIILHLSELYLQEAIDFLSSYGMPQARYRNHLQAKIDAASATSIIRQLEFSETHKQAGISILSYFANVLKQKQPSVIACIKIEQSESVIRMIIETPEGSKEIVEKTLEGYVEVVTDKIKPEDFFENPLHIMELKHKLEIAKLEIRQKEEILRISERQRSALEDRVANLENIVSEQYRSMGHNLSSVVNVTDKVVLLLERTATQQLSPSVSQLVEDIKDTIKNGVDHNNIEDIKKAIIEIKNKDTSVFTHLLDILGKGSVSGAAGNELYKWIEYARALL